MAESSRARAFSGSGKRQAVIYRLDCQTALIPEESSAFIGNERSWGKSHLPRVAPQHRIIALLLSRNSASCHAVFFTQAPKQAFNGAIWKGPHLVIISLTAVM